MTSDTHLWISDPIDGKYFTLEVISLKNLNQHLKILHSKCILIMEMSNIDYENRFLCWVWIIHQ